MSTHPRIPRSRPAVIPVGGRSIWLELPPALRIAVVVIVTVAVVMTLRGWLLS